MVTDEAEKSGEVSWRMAIWAQTLNKITVYFFKPPFKVLNPRPPLSSSSCGGKEGATLYMNVTHRHSPKLLISCYLSPSYYLPPYVSG